MSYKRAVMRTLLYIFIPGLLIVHAEKFIEAGEREHAKQWYQKGEALSDNSEEELSYYQEAIKIYPDYAKAYNRIGEIYKARGNYSSAVEAFTKACEISPSLSIAHNNRGEIYFLDGRYDRARVEFIKALEYDPGLKKAQNNLGFLKGLAENQPSPLLSKLPSPVFARNTGYVLPPRGLTSNFYTRYFSKRIDLLFGGDSGDVVSRDVKILKVGYIFLYGINKIWSIGVHPTFITKECRIERVGLIFRPRVSGLGDTIITNKFHLFKKKKASMAAYFNLSLPTGDDEIYPIYQDKEFAVSLGSGRTHLIWGINYSGKKFDSFFLHLNVEYRLNGKVNTIDVGDELYYNIALCTTAPYTEDSYFAAGRTRNFVLSMELNGRHRGKSEPMWPQYEFGGDIVYLSPGIQLMISRYRRIEFGIQIPVIKPDEGWEYSSTFIFRITTYGF
ncbi:MAG: tetratricopeptide repeat protein [bacterium]